MRQPENHSGNTPDPDPGPPPDRARRSGGEESPNAFSAAFLDRLRRHSDHPPTPEAANAGPWKVVRSGPRERSAPIADSGAGEPYWSCVGIGEEEARAHLVTADLACLTAAALPLTGLAPRFHLAEDPDIELPLCDLFDGDSTVGVVDGWSPDLADRLNTLDALRCRPLSLAHFLLAVGDETLRRVGRILVEIAADEEEDESP